MSFEIDAISPDPYSDSYASDSWEKSTSIDSHHEMICNHTRISPSLASKFVQILCGSTREDKKVVKLYSAKGGEIKAGVKFDWGKAKEQQLTYWLEGKHSDDHGNSFQAKLLQNGDGTGNLEISGSHENKN